MELMQILIEQEIDINGKLHEHRNGDRNAWIEAKAMLNVVSTLWRENGWTEKVEQLSDAIWAAGNGD